MSTKIYREVTSKFNDETQKWETISEDSYDYDGPIDFAQGGDMDEDWRNLDEVFKDLGKDSKFNFLEGHRLLKANTISNAASPEPTTVNDLDEESSSRL